VTSSSRRPQDARYGTERKRLNYKAIIEDRKCFVSKSGRGTDECAHGESKQQKGRTVRDDRVTGKRSSYARGK
jgi:hypothetical protein